MHNVKSKVVLASLVGIAFMVIWMLYASEAAPRPRDKGVSLESESVEPLASAVRLQEIGRALADGAKTLENLEGALQVVDSASAAPESPPVDGSGAAGPLQDLLRILASTPMRLKSGANWEVKIEDTDINPRALQIPDAAMAAFRAWEGVYVDGLAGMGAGLNQLRSEEMTALAKTGVLRPLRYTSDPVVLADMEESRKLSRRHGDGEPGFFGASYYEGAEGLSYFVRVDASTYGASEADLPQYRSTKHLYRECVRQAYVQAAMIARASGLLDESQFQERVERARKRRI